MKDLLLPCRLAHLCTLTIFLLFLYPGNSAAGDLRLRGYIKPLVAMSDTSSIDITYAGYGQRPADREFSFSSRLRVSAFLKLSGNLKAEAAYELAPTLRDPDADLTSLSLQGADPLSYRVGDAGNALSSKDGSDLIVYQNIDRLFLTFTTGPADIYFGRQPIAFGSARVVNPTDIFTAFTFSEINTEDRAGVDALRVRMPLGQLSELDAGIIGGDGFRFKKGAAFLRGRFAVLDSDISPIAAVFRENLMTGIDIASSIGDAGFWVEAAAVFADAVGGHDPEDDYFRLSTGLDYNFTGSLYAFVEYHFNGAGEDDPENYTGIISGLISRTAYRDGAVYLLGKHYISPGFSYELTPLATLGSRALFNLTDSSLFLAPSLQYSLSDNGVFEAGAFLAFGSHNDIVSSQGMPAIIASTKSEFGLYANIYFISTRYYF